MTRADLNEILSAIDAVREREKRYCAEYVRNNKEDKANRERDRDLIIAALNSAEYEIKRRYKEMTA